MFLGNRIIRDEPYNYNFLFLDSPLKAIRIIDNLVEDKQEIALVMSDQVMPQMQGIDFFRQTKNKIPESVRILLTGQAGMGSALSAINENILDKYLTKPIKDLDDLVVTIRHLLNEYQLKRQLDAQHKFIAGLYEFGNFLNAQTNLAMILEQTLAFTCQALECSRVSIMLLENGNLTLKAARGIPKDILKHMVAAIDAGVATRVLKQQEAILVQDIDQVPWLTRKINQEYKSFISSPIIYAGLNALKKPLGIINATNKIDNKPFDEDDLKIVNFISSTASIAINNQQDRYRLEQNYLNTIDALSLALEARDPYSRGHSFRVMKYAEAIAKNMKLNSGERNLLKNAAILHDVGKIGIKDHILLKPDRLTPEEMLQIREHPKISEAIILPISFLKEAGRIVRHHHERFDGAGYPDQIKGEKIPLPARIMAVADTYDAMTSNRPYRQALSADAALRELENNAGTQLDPGCVESFLSHLRRG